MDDGDPQPLATARAQARRLGNRLRSDRLTLATAESCTGGLVGALLTALPGSSHYYLGGVIAYSNRAKIVLLGVPPATLTAHGAVSAATATAMAQGMRERLGADLAVSITGIAGPGGGSDEKPVGLVFVALATAAEPVVRRLSLAGSRQAVRSAAAAAALELVWESLNV